MAKDSPPLSPWQASRVWAATLPALLLGAAWVGGDLLQHRPTAYVLIDGGALLGCFLLALAGYALVRRFARNAR
jgi:hypothetical protein